MARAHVFAILALLIAPAAARSVSSNAGALELAGQAREQSLEQAWSKTLDADAEAKKSPVKRVIILLEEMKAELMKEADKESEMYDKMVCWCETNEKEKTAAISGAEAKAADLTAEIASRAAAKGELSTNIKAMKVQIAEDTASLKEATALREKEAAEFSAEEKEMMQAITNLKNAVMVLSKHHSSFLQANSPELASIRAVMEDARLKYDLLQAGSNRLGAPKKRSFAALLAMGNEQGADKTVASVLGMHDSVDVLPVDIAQHMLARAAKEAAPAFVQGNPASYAPASGQIFGILKTMKEEFEANLSQAQKDEMKAAAEFEELSKSKSAQIAAAKEKLDGMEESYADNQKALADAKEDFELTTGQRSSDVEFLRNLRLTCQDLDRQWNERSKTRSLEIKAVSEALVVLTEDDNREHLAKTVTLLQVVSDSVSDSTAQVRRSKTIDFLRKAVREPSFEADDLLAAWKGRGTPVGGAGGPRTQLATLAVSAQLDTFAKVKELMDKMVADLKSEQEEEVKFKANCETEFATTEKTTYTKKEEKEDLEALIESLAKTITTLKEEISAASTSISETEVAIKKASETREKENAEFQTVVADQRATQTILKKALSKLEAFYGKKAAFLASAAATASKQTPPVQFNKYKNNAGSNSVMGLLEQIIEDSVALEKEATAAETEAQANYESFVKDSNDVIDKLSTSVTEKTKAVANSKLSSEQAKSDLKSTDEELETLAEYEGDLHQQCDWVLKNFNIRQAARLQEIEAIGKAKSILSGAME